MGVKCRDPTSLLCHNIKIITNSMLLFAHKGLFIDCESMKAVSMSSA